MIARGRKPQETGGNWRKKLSWRRKLGLEEELRLRLGHSHTMEGVVTVAQ